MDSVNKLDPASLWHGNRAELVGTTFYDHPERGWITTMIVVILEGSQDASDYAWLGELNAKISISERDQGNLVATTIHLPRSIEIGSRFVLEDPEGDRKITVHSITVY